MQRIYATIRQTAERFGVSERQIHRLLRAGSIKAKKLSPRLTLVSVASADRFFASLPDREAPDEQHTAIE